MHDKWVTYRSLTVVAVVGGYSQSSGKPRNDVLCKDSKGNFVVSCVHGDRNGSMYLQGNPGKHLSADEIRDVASEFYGYYIPTDAPLFLTPCYPAGITRRRGPSLVKQNIRVLGNWWGPTYYGVIKNSEDDGTRINAMDEGAVKVGDVIDICLRARVQK